MKILLLIRALTPGGAERQAVLVATGLKARGHDVALVVLYRTGSALESAATTGGVPVLDLGKRARWDVLRPLLRLRALLRHCDVVYSFLPTANVLAALLAGGRRRPAVVAGFRGTDTVRASHDWLGQLLIRAEHWLRGRFAAAIVNSGSGLTFRRARGWPASQLTVVRNGLPPDTPGFNAAARAELRRAWGLTVDTPVIGFAGRLDPVKDVESLLEAVAVMARQDPTLELVIAGGGDAGYVAGLHARAAALGVAGRTRFLGSQTTLTAFYSAIDLLCLPSRSEGCSNVLAEALACGTPAVATDVGEASLLLEDARSLAMPGDTADLVRALHFGLQQRSVATAQGRTAVIDTMAPTFPDPPRSARRERVLALLDHTAMLVATEAVLRRATGKRADTATAPDGVASGGRTQDGAAPAIDVMLVTMVFPWPSEAFAGVEARALRDCGTTLRIRALRGHHPDAAGLLADWGLGDLDLTSSGFASVLRGLAHGLAHPGLFLAGLAWLLRHGWSRPVLLARCLALTPRMLDLLRECRARPPDALYLFWGHYPAWLGHLVSRCLPGVHVAQSLNAYDLLYAFPPSLDLARRAHSLWTTTPANAPALAARGVPPERLRIGAHGLDLRQLPAAAGSRDPWQLVTVARLAANKGVDDTLRVTAVLAGEGLPVRLTVIGEGPERQRLEQLAADLGVAARVTFTGGIGHSAVYAALANASVFLLLSRSPAERVPNAAKEALASGCICVLTETPGVQELVGALEHPLVVPMGDWRPAAACVRAVLTAPARYAPDRERGRAHVRQVFDARQIARQRLAVWTASDGFGVAEPAARSTPGPANTTTTTSSAAPAPAEAAT